MLKTAPFDLAEALSLPSTTLAGVPGGFDGKVVADLLGAARRRGVRRIVLLARGGSRLSVI